MTKLDELSKDERLVLTHILKPFADDMAVEIGVDPVEGLGALRDLVLDGYVKIMYDETDDRFWLEAQTPDGIKIDFDGVTGTCEHGKDWHSSCDECATKDGYK